MKKVAVALVILFALATICQADVVIKRKTSMEGMMGMGDSESSETEYVSADKSYTERSTKFTGGMMAKATKGKKNENIQITRLDKGMVWNLEPDGKTYTEMSLDSMKMMMQALQGSMKDMPMGNDKIDDSMYDWTVDYKGPVDAGEVDGYKCTSLSGTAIGTNKEDPKDKVRITYEYWLAKDIPGYDQMNDFYMNFAKAIGMDDYRSQQGMEAMARKWMSHFGDMMQKMKDAGGFPMKINMLVETTGETEGGAAPEITDTTEGGKKAAEMMGKISGLFGQKKQAKSADGMSTVFSMSQEVTSIEEKSTDAGKYELPSGYKKK